MGQELWYFTWVFYETRTLHGYQSFWPCDLDFGVWPTFWKLIHFLFITMELCGLDLVYVTWVFLVTEPFHGNQYFWPCDLDLGVWHILKKKPLTLHFWTVSARALIFHMSILWDKNSLWVPKIPWPWILAYFFNTLIVSARALVLHMNIPCDKIFLLVLNILTLTDDQLKRILELPYCIWSYLVTKSFCWYQNICPCDLGNLWNWPLSGAFVFHKHILFKVKWWEKIALNQTFHINLCIFSDLFKHVIPCVLQGLLKSKVF